MPWHAQRLCPRQGVEHITVHVGAQLEHLPRRRRDAAPASDRHAGLVQSSERGRLIYRQARQLHCRGGEAGSHLSRNYRVLCESRI